MTKKTNSHRSVGHRLTEPTGPAHEQDTLTKVSVKKGEFGCGFVASLIVRSDASRKPGSKAGDGKLG